MGISIPPGLTVGQWVEIVIQTKVNNVIYKDDPEGDGEDYLETDMTEYYSDVGEDVVSIRPIPAPIPREKFSIIEARDIMTRDTQNLVLLNSGWLTDDGSVWNEESFEVIRVVRQGA